MADREFTKREFYEALVGITGLIVLLVAAWQLGGAWGLLAAVGAFLVCWSFS